MRIRLLMSFLALAFSILVVGSLTACGSSPSKPSSGSTPAPKAANADGCAAGTTIPQGGGDQDADNSGGPSDGDGCL